MENDLGIIITISSMGITFVAAMIVLFLWTRAESRSDIRHMDNKLDVTRELVRAIHDEVKDFHIRLVEIEKNRK